MLDDLISFTAVLDDCAKRGADLSDIKRAGQTGSQRRAVPKRALPVARLLNALLESRVPQQFAGSFELLRQIGAGGFGTVYEARDRLDGRIVAVKVLHAIDAHAASRFDREVSLLSGLQHASIVRYLGHGRTTDDRPYLAMEWLEGQTLEVKLKSGALSVNDALLVARCVIAGLEQAQQLGIVHRDLKPGNLLLVRGNAAETKILDFGLARRLDDAQAFTRTGVAIGTPHYMSPEQARGERLLDLASDVFALGSVLYECLTGAQPFETGHALATLMMICVQEPPRIESLRSDVPALFARLVHAMLSKARTNRPTLAAIASELDYLIARSRDDAAAAETRPLVLHAESTSRALTPSSEQRVLSALLLGHAGPSEAALDPTLHTLLPTFGARGERLLDGSRILLLDSHVTAGEQALAAARLALALRAIVAVPMVLCTGRALVERHLPLGDLIERGARLLGETQGEDILLDEASTALLDTRFEISGPEGRRTLVGERLGGEAPRTLLGQVTPFVGRERELTRLLGLCQEAIEDLTAKVVLVVGSAGAGKSRLRYELVRRLQIAAPGLAVLSAQGDSMRVSTPLGMLSSMLHAWAELRSSDTQAIKRHRLTTSVQRVLAAERADLVAPFLGEMIGVPFPDESSAVLRVARRDPQLMADRLLSSFLEWLEALSVSGPIALLVEDLHWADAPSVRFLDAALAVLAERPFMLAAFARPEVRTSFPTLWAERDLFEMRLPKLSAQVCERLLQAIGTTDLSESTQHWVIERAEGNPFFLEELVRGLRARSADRDTLPDTIVGIIQTRLDALGEGPKWLVRAASVFGQVFQATALEALVGEHAKHLDFAGWLHLLTERDVLFVRSESDAREYVFRHALIRDAAYALLTVEERKLGHRLAAEWLEQHACAEPSVLADHFELGEVPDRAAFWYCAAAAAALEASSLPEVVRCGERAVRFGAGGEALGEVASLVAEALAYRGEQAVAVGWAARARAHAAPGGAAWWRASQVLTVALILGQGSRDQAAQAIEEMLELATDQALAEEAVVALSVVASNATIAQLGDYGPRLLTLLEDLPSAALGYRAQGHLHSAKAAVALVSSPEHAIREQREALAQFQRAGSLHELLPLQVNLGWLLLDSGLLDEAEACLCECILLGDKLGLRGEIANARQRLALVYLARGKADLAEHTLREALSACGLLQDPREESLSRAHLARMLLHRGELDEASDLIGKARDLGGVDPSTQAVALAVSAEVDRRCGRFESALTFGRAAMALRQAHHLVEDVALMWVSLVEALLACGHIEEARSSLGEALIWLNARADMFADSAWRKAFLTQVPDNARLIALAEPLNRIGHDPPRLRLVPKEAALHS